MKANSLDFDKFERHNNKGFRRTGRTTRQYQQLLRHLGVSSHSKILLSPEVIRRAGSNIASACVQQ